MQARLTTAAIGPGETDSVAEIFEHVVPAMRDLDGYVGFVVLADDEGSVIVLSLWENKAAMAASDEIAERIKTAETAQREFEIEDTARYRVVSFDIRK